MRRVETSRRHLVDLLRRRPLLDRTPRGGSDVAPDPSWADEMGDWLDPEISQEAADPGREPT